MYPGGLQRCTRYQTEEGGSPTLSFPRVYDVLRKSRWVNVVYFSLKVWVKFGLRYLSCPLARVNKYAAVCCALLIPNDGFGPHVPRRPFIRAFNGPRTLLDTCSTGSGFSRKPLWIKHGMLQRQQATSESSARVRESSCFQTCRQPKHTAACIADGM